MSRIRSIIVALSLAAGPIASAQTYQFFDFHYADTSFSHPSSGTSINDKGEIVGTWTHDDGITHGFYRALTGVTPSRFVSLDFPSPVPSDDNATVIATIPYSINFGGAITGVMLDAIPPSKVEHASHAFLLSGAAGSFEIVDPPGAPILQGASTNISFSGTVLGSAAPTIEGPFEFYLRSAAGAYTTLPPCAGVVGTGGGLFGRNDHGDMIGAIYDANNVSHALLRTAGGTCTVLPDPPGSNGTSATGINDAGTIVGSYEDAQGNSHGFVRDAAGNYETVDRGPNTEILAINNLGIVVGSLYPSNEVVPSGEAFYAAPEVAAALSISTTSLSFPPVGPGVTSQPEHIEVSNLSDQTVVLGEPSVTVNTAFAIAASSCPTIFSPGQSCGIDVTARTNGVRGLQEATLQIQSNATGSLVLQVQLSVVGENNSFQITPASYAFGWQAVGTTSGPGYVFLYASGGLPVNFTSIQIIGTNAPDFTITSNTCSPTLAAFQSCQIGFTLTPSAAGPRHAQIQIQDNATGSPQLVNLVGQGR